MFSLHRSYALLTVLLAASTLGASSLLAQEVVSPALGATPATEMASAAPAVPLAGGAPTLPWGVHVASAPFVELAPAPVIDAVAFGDRVGAGTNIAMMGVGGAALVVGLIMGGDNGMIIATTGGVIGLVGLFRWLR